MHAERVDACLKDGLLAEIGTSIASTRLGLYIPKPFDHLCFAQKKKWKEQVYILTYFTVQINGLEQTNALMISYCTV